MGGFLPIAFLLTGLAAHVQGAEPAKPLKLPEGVTQEQLKDAKEAAKIADQLEKEYPAPRSEAVRMLAAILRGSQLNGRDGWFGPAQSRYDFAWLAARAGVDAKAGSIPKAKFTGPAKLFDQLDRDGAITPADLDWSDKSPYVMQAGFVNRIFRQLDRSGDGKLTKEEFDGFFKYLAAGQEEVTADDLRRALLPRGPSGFNPGDAPSIPVLVKGLFAGEIGSMGEGPKLGATAPDFALKTADGEETVRLSKLTGTKPVVLVFGNFTCGPFRSLYPDVEAIYRRHKDEATFVMVYVREAHPTDGWKMDSNGRMGVAVKQPTTNDERIEVCQQFQKKFQPGMKVVVDDIADPTGTAYSGMPARLYVIDAKGKVAYKSGRGPFGFKPGEMEQALVMSLADSALAAEPKPMTSTLRKDGALLVDGKPVLPYGFYISTGHTGDMRLKCVERIHAIGGTVVHIEGPWHEDTRFLDKAAELGLWVVAGHTESEAKLDRVKKYKDHPAIIAWTLYDDANTLSTAAHLAKMNKLVKGVVPHRLTYIPLGTQSRNVLMPSAEFFECSDFVGWEMYPVANPKAADPSLKATETQMALVAETAAKAHRPYWILPQTFAWPGGRVPTPAEYRNMCYVGLINGAKGVMPWSIYHMVDSAAVRAKKKAEGEPAWEEWYLPDSKELWAECASMAAELKALTPFLLEGKRTKLTVGGDVTAAVWVGETEAVVVVANLSEKDTKSVSLKLPNGLIGKPMPVFKDRPSGLTVIDGKLSGDLGKAEVHVYRFATR